MTRIEKCFKRFFAPAIKSDCSHFSRRFNLARFISRYTLFNSCRRATFVVLMDENNAISEVTSVQGLVFVPPCPPMRTPCFPIAKTSTGGLAWCWVKRCVGRLCCIPCLIGASRTFSQQHPISMMYPCTSPELGPAEPFRCLKVEYLDTFGVDDSPQV